MGQYNIDFVGCQAWWKIGIVLLKKEAFLSFLSKKLVMVSIRKIWK